MERLGRNDPCWCKSGKKYKSCHLRFDEDKNREIQKILRQAVSQEKHLLEKQIWEWKSYREAMLQELEHSEKIAEPLLAFVSKLEVILGKVLDRPLKLDSDAPHNYVLAILVTRAFRLTIGAVLLALSGYHDLVPNLSRTVWEVGVRMMDMQEDLAAAAYGFLLHSETEKIGQIEADLNDLKANNKELGNLEQNLKTLKNYHSDISEIARRRGIDPEKSEKRFGKLNVRRTVEKYGGAKAYKVSYSFLSSYVHEKNAATKDFLVPQENIGIFLLGPLSTPEYAVAEIFDSLRILALVLKFSAELLDEKDLSTDLEQIIGGIFLARNESYKFCGKEEYAEEPN